jgi:sodium transport system permease protein
MNSIFKILKKELIEVFRDKKSLAMMLIIPVLIPALVIGMSALFASEVNKPIDDYNRIGFNYKLSEVEKALAKEYNIIVYEIDDDKIEDEYNKGNIDLYITREKNENTIYGDDIKSYTMEDNVYIINGNDNDTTSYAASLMKDFYSDYKESLQAEYLSNKGINPSEVSNILTVSENIITKNNYFASYIINYAFLFIIMAITISATYPATDATAGEKERGTLETLLTFPIRSKDIIIGKFLSISLSSIITGILGLLLTEVSLAFAKDNFDIYDGANLLLSSKALIFAIIVIISYSFLISGLCVAIAS